MKFPWQKESKAPVELVKGRGAVIPKTYKFHVAKNITSNNWTVNSYSTIITTVKILKEGETAESVSTWTPGTINTGANRQSLEEVEAQGLQRVQFDAPNWIGLIISTDESAYIEHVELPVWLDAATGKVDHVDVPALVQQYEHRREHLSKLWGQRDGPFSDIHALISLPSDALKTAKYIGSVPGEIFGAVREMIKDDGPPPDPLPKHVMPDLSQYPPVDGFDFYAWAEVRFNPLYDGGLSQTDPTFAAADQEWRARVSKDWKLSSLQGNLMERYRKLAKQAGK